MAMADVNKSRRGFLSRLLLALGGLAGLEAGWVATTFFGARREVGSNEQRDKVMVAGPIDRFQPGSVTPFRDGEFYLARLEGGGFLALHRKCTHLGCTVPWIPDDVLSAPAPRPLDVFPVSIENGLVKVDITKPIRRNAFEPQQVSAA